MKNLFVGTMVALGVGLLLWYFLKSSKVGQNEQGDDCVGVNRQKFTVPWIEDKIPGGTLGRISKSIFGSDDPKYGNIVSGFFKAIDVYPSDGAGKYYKNQIEAYYHSPIGLPKWQVVQGELACD